MGIYDRDWFWEDHDAREAKYGKNFNTNNNSSRKKRNASNKAFLHNGNLSEGFKNALRESKVEQEKALFAIAASFFGVILVLLLYDKFHYTLPFTLMLIYDVWMLFYIFTKRPKPGLGTRLLALFFFLFSVGFVGGMLYLLYLGQ